ncbi:MAG: hypothetical protein QM784_13580 [Polyangiaceae bacterium]
MLARRNGPIVPVVMQLDLERTSDTDLYQLATHIVTPRPIAWVTTQNADGIVNLAPFQLLWAGV